MMPKVKGAEDQSVNQDDPFTFQDVATMLKNHDETVVLSGSDISSQNEGKGRGDQGRGGINSGGTVSPPTRSTSNRCREPSSLYESQPTKRSRLATNESPAHLEATGVTSALNVDYQRELVWTKLQVLKDKYLGDMNELYGFLSDRSTKPMPAEQLQKLKHYKDVLHRMIPYLRVPKDRVPKEFNQDKVDAFEKQIVNIMETFRKRRGPPSAPATNESPAHLEATGVTSALNVDYQRELVWIKLQVLKDKYLGDMNELYGILSDRSTKPMPAEQLRKLKHYKDVLHRMIPYLRVSKDRVPKELNQDKVDAFEKQTLTIFETFRKKR